jgi:hypothetical protein
MTTPRPHSRQPKQLDAGIFQAEISSFALRLAAEGKAAKTIQTYTEAVRWFAATCLPGLADWEQVSSQDVQRWMAWLLDRYSSAYASNQYRAAAVLQMAGRRRQSMRRRTNSIHILPAESVLVAHGSQARQSGAHIDHFCALAGITRRRPDQFGGGEL